MTNHTLLTELQYYRDDSTQQTLDEIRQVSFQPFIERHRHTSNLGFSSAAHWFQLRLNNNTTQAITPYLALKGSQMDQYDLYLVADEKIIHHRLGDRYPFSQRPILSPHFVVPIPFAPVKASTSTPAYNPAVWYMPTL